ncbi:MAG: hypothetical protein ACUVWP_01070 [bacterium]
MDFDSSYNEHIAYYDEYNEDLKYAFHNGNLWSVETVDSSGMTGEYPHIDVDKDDNVHITYHRIDTGDLKYAKKNYGNNSWSIESVDTTGVVGDFLLYKNR